MHPAHFDRNSIPMLSARGGAVQVDCLPGTRSPSDSAHILVIDNDSRQLKLLCDYLRGYDMRATALPSASGIADAMVNTMVDLLVLNVRLPGDDALQVARHMRDQSDVPIIMLSARTDEADRVMALEMGADDYITKPFSPRELLARIRALLRRSRRHETIAGVLQRLRGYRFAGWELNVRLRRLISPTGERVHLTNNEFNLLAAFLAAPQHLLSRSQLLGLSRLHNDEVYDRSIDVQVSRLRKKIPAPPGQPPYIRTERGVGYVFAAVVETFQ